MTGSIVVISLLILGVSLIISLLPVLLNWIKTIHCPKCGSWFTLEAVVVLLVFSSCAPMTKEQYISEYRQFIVEVKKNKDNLTDEQWQEKDKLFGKYSTKYYSKYEPQLTIEERIVLAKYRLEYDVYSNGAKEALLDIFNSYIEMEAGATDIASDAVIKKKNILKKQIENYIENEMNNDTDFLIEQGKKVKDTFNYVFNELSTKTEEN